MIQLCLELAESLNRMQQTWSLALGPGNNGCNVFQHADLCKGDMKWDLTIKSKMSICGQKRTTLSN